MQDSPRRSRVALISLILIAGAVRITQPVAMGRFGALFNEVYLEYVVAARRLATHGAFLSPWSVDDDACCSSAIMPPAYTGLVAGTFVCFGIESESSTILLQLLNIVASTAIIPLIFVTTRRLSDSRAAWIAALITAVNPLLIGFSDYIWDTTLFAFFVTLAMYVSVRIAQTGPRPRSMFAFGLLLGGIALLNPALTIAYPVILLRSVFRARCIRRGAAASCVVAAVVGFGIAVAPWTARNYATLGRLMYIRNGLGLQLWLGVCPEVHDGKAVWERHYPMRNTRLEESSEFASDSFEMAYVDQCLKKAVASIESDPARWIRLSLRRTCDFWFGTVMSNSDGRAIPRGTFRRMVMMFIMCETLLIVLLTLVARRVPRNAGWLIVSCGLYSVVYCLTFTMLRFRAPMEPIVAVTLALCIRQLWRNDSPTEVASAWLEWKGRSVN